MLEEFCEYMVKRKKGTSDIVKISLIALAGLLLTYVLMLFAAYIASLLLPLAVLVWYCAYRLMQKTNIEFEYALTSGELDIDRIENKMKRKRLLSVHSRDIQLMAPLSGGEYTDRYKSLKTVDATSNTGASNVYFAVLQKDGQKMCLLFEPTSPMLDMMHRLNPEKIHIDNR